MDKQSTVAAIAILVLLLSVTFGIMLVSANPISVPPIKVSSPENNKIYPSNQALLSFSVTNANENFSSFYYSLDGKEPVYTNQSCVLTNLPSGSHNLIIYGNSTDHPYWKGHELLYIVYFSTIYSTAWLTFALILTVNLVSLYFLIFFGRKRIANRLKSEKKISFWLGLPCFLFFSLFVFIPSFWTWAYRYLFPHFPVGMEESPIFGIMFSIPFMALGLLLMLFGTRSGKSRFDSKIKELSEKNTRADL
jgi:hypothetical protein